MLPFLFIQHSCYVALFDYVGEVPILAFQLLPKVGILGNSDASADFVISSVWYPSNSLPIKYIIVSPAYKSFIAFPISSEEIR